MPRALVVDDDHSLRFAVTEVLKQAGYQTIEAENGLDALNILRQDAAFDIILSDVQMSKMDGLRFLEDLKIDYPNIPVVMLSIHSTWDWVSQAMEKGAVRYLPKPFNRQQLMETIREAAGA